MTATILDELFMVIGKNFTVDTYLITTKVQGILWSASDVLIIFGILKIIDLVRKENQRERIVIRHVLLWLSALLVPFLVIPRTSRGFFLLESIIFGLQIVIVLYSIFADAKATILFFKEKVQA